MDKHPRIGDNYLIGQLFKQNVIISIYGQYNINIIEAFYIVYFLWSLWSLMYILYTYSTY